MADELRVETTEDEQDNLLADQAIVFRIDDSGSLTIRAEWGGTDELYGDGCAITIPPRVWAIAAPWISARVRA